MDSLLLRLWLSGAIYQLLFRLTNGNLLNGCETHLPSERIFICKNVDIDKAIPSIPSYATTLEISISEQKYLTLPINSYLPSLNSLKLTNGQLEEIEDGSLSGLINLEHLSLANNKLSYLKEHSVFGLYKLQTLDLQKNRFVSLNDVIPALFHIVNLNSLDLSNNLLASVYFEEVEKLANLTIYKLNFNDCRITSADPLVLTNWDIRELYISKNPIDEKCLKNISLGLQNSKVHTLEALKLSSLAFSFGETPLLELYNSKIQVLTIGGNEFTFTLTFRSFFSLKTLTVIDGVFSEFDTGALFKLPHLEDVILRGNSIKHLTVRKSTSNVSNLKTLEMRNNNALIPDGMFSYLSNLLELKLQETQLGNTITSKMFLGLENLLTLRIFRCSIEEIEDAAFQDLESLKFLSLQNNKLHSLRSDIFIGLHNLTQLFLHNNNLASISIPSPFRHLTSLGLLVLNDNNIVHLKSFYFANLTNLEVVDLSSNFIVPWNVSLIPEGGRIRSMFLQSNALNTVTPAMLKDFDGLEAINLADNKFDCGDCNMQKFQQWIVSTNTILKELGKYPEAYICHSPESLKGASIVTVKIDTEHCGLKQEKIILLSVAIFSTLMAMIIVGIVLFKLRWHFRYCCYILRSRVKRFREVQDSYSYEYDAFVSYDPVDCSWITHHLLATLETDDLHIKFYLFDRDCAGGNDVIEEIFEVVQKCRKTLLVLSESYVKNQWCMFEMQMAQHSLFEEKRDSLILIQLEPIEERMISANLSYLITTRTYIMWTDHPMGQKLFWKRLHATLVKPDILRMSRIV